MAERRGGRGPPPARRVRGDRRTCPPDNLAHRWPCTASHRPVAPVDRRVPAFLRAWPGRLPWAWNSVGPRWPGSGVLAGAAPRPPCWPAGSPQLPGPCPARPPGPRPCAGPPRRRGAGGPPGPATAPETGVAGPLVLCWLGPTGRWAQVGPVRPCPAEVAGAGCVLPSRPAPCRGLSPPLRTRRATTPQGQAAGCPWRRLPVLGSPASLRFPPGSGAGWPLPCLTSGRPRRCFPRQQPVGLPPCCDRALPACRGLWTPADRPLLAQADRPVVPAGAFKPSASAARLFDAVPALQGARSPRRPPGYAVSASPLWFAVFPRLRLGRQTRYGWGASPDPPGTCTLPEMPSFSWRDNAGPQARWAAGARHEQTLAAVAFRVEPVVTQPAPPQTRTCAMNASGSSVTSLSARGWRITVLPCMASQMWWTILGMGRI